MDTQVVLIGRSGGEEIDAADMAGRLGTIPYEVLTSLSPRIGRAYLTRKEAK
jgi:alanine racemase